MRILLSNDDGIHAPGIQTLAKHLREFADVQVVAPDRNRSGASNSLTLESSLRTFTFDNGDIAVQMGTPTDCVFLGVNALMRPRPDIVVSGINAGLISAMTLSTPVPSRRQWKGVTWGSRRWRCR
ncbi:bifunctional 5'-3'-nucleotidase/exopolyphosphatase SurE [Enterobacter cancerogenus]|uniref:5'-nucleotidase n=1 Tax=Enterobacter cancerogenus TaxID=69218 RepID=A0A484Z9F6_9ENTR|nr:bifunctional 5'-3'-nucleotidase/exopolyphosphatase SurE [Enterobacter cancerogenus]